MHCILYTGMLHRAPTRSLTQTITLKVITSNPNLVFPDRITKFIGRATNFTQSAAILMLSLGVVVNVNVNQNFLHGSVIAIAISESTEGYKSREIQYYNNKSGKEMCLNGDGRLLLL